MSQPPPPSTSKLHISISGSSPYMWEQARGGATPPPVTGRDVEATFRRELKETRAAE
jgi:hypothetical protein